MTEERKVESVKVSIISPIKKGGMDSVIFSKAPELDKNSAEYKAMGESFDKQFGEKTDLKFLEEKTKRLDAKFKVLQDCTREAESSNCDMLLFKKV